MMSKDDKKILEQIILNSPPSLNTPKMRNLLHQMINLTDMLDEVRDGILQELKK